MFCWSDVSLEQGNVLRKVLGEPSDVGVGTLLVGKHVTASVSCTALYKGEAERWGERLYNVMFNCFKIMHV